MQSRKNPLHIFPPASDTTEKGGCFMKKSTLRQLAGFGLALSVILCISTVYYAKRASIYGRYIQTSHEKQLAALTEQLSQMDTALKKAAYLPEGAMRQTLAAAIWSSSQQASAALASLPLSAQPREKLEKYLTQTGDYAYYLLRSGAYENASSEEWETLSSLSQQAEALLQTADLLQQQNSIGSLDFRAVEQLASQQEDDFSARLRQTDEELPEYATLIYDGPYSDHVAQRTPLGLEGLPILSRQETETLAADFLGKADITYLSSSEGQIPADFYQYGSRTAAFSRQGGMLLSLSDNRQLGERTILPEDAVNIALTFAKNLGLPEMQASYYTTYESIVTVNLAAVDNGVICYPDLIKVGVALDDGSVVRYDGLGYAMNHHARSVPAPSISPEDARAVIAPGLKLSAERLVYIPTSGYYEVLCRELICLTPEGTHIIYDVNAQTGQTENLLLLVETDNGILTR